MPVWGLPALSWLISFYFLLNISTGIGFPLPGDLSASNTLCIFLWLFFLFIPFFSKIKVGAFLELERQLEQGRQELRDFKGEVRNTLSVLSTNINRQSNQVTVNVPKSDDIRAERNYVEAQYPGVAEGAEELEKVMVAQSGEDVNFALVRTRIEIERYLRKITNKRLAVTHDNINTKFMSARRLFELFLKNYPEYSHLSKSFYYVNQVCDAAIHAQIVTGEQADEALALGAQIIAVLTEESGKSGPE